jgi:DNA polymerase alpha/epsilon subunit B
MLTQSHLCPFVSSVQPVHWDFDGALSLFPQPDALVVTEPGPVQSVDIHGVRCAGLTS